MFCCVSNSSMPILNESKADIIEYFKNNPNKCDEIPKEEFMKVFRMASEGNHAGGTWEVHDRLLQSPVMASLPITALREMTRNIAWPCGAYSHHATQRGAAILKLKMTAKMNTEELTTLGMSSQLYREVADFAQEKLGVKMINLLALAEPKRN